MSIWAEGVLEPAAMWDVTGMFALAEWKDSALD
jgi:hypothetical protein